MQIPLPVQEDYAGVRPLPDVLQNFPDAVQRILLIGSCPEPVLRDCIAGIEQRWPDCDIWLLCHPGRNIEGCRPLYYQDEGFFRLGKIDTSALQSLSFDLAVLPYATDRRLSPCYSNVDRIAAAAGAGHTLIYYRDGNALAVDRNFFEAKYREVVRPYLRRRQATLAEICAFTGESLPAVERRCELAGIEAVKIWREMQPRSAGEVYRYYAENDFYIYELMKTEYNGDRDELVTAVLAECEPGRRVVDYGAGVGIFSIPLAAAGVRATHADLPGPLLEFARYRFARRGLAAEFLPLQAEKPLRAFYDVIVSVYVIEHVPDPAATLRHLAGHVRPGGKLILAVDFDQRRSASERLPLHLAHLAPQDYYALTGSIGLDLVSSRGGLDVFRVPE